MKDALPAILEERERLHGRTEAGDDLSTTTQDQVQSDKFLEDAAQWEMLEPRGFSTYAEAGCHRRARAKGIALSTIDTLIAAIALEHGARLFTLDQDFTRIARLTRLALYRPPLP
jgi:predicted nucleic acid-binding protein